MLPLLQKEVVEKRGLATQEEILSYFAVGQCTPGIIAVNTATFVGYKQRGVLGAIAATLGLVTPSIIIIMVVARILNVFENNPWVEHAFVGIRIVVVALIVDAVVKFYKSGVKNGVGVILFIGAFALAAFMDVSPVFIVCASVVAGILYGVYVGRNQREGKA